MKVEVIHTAGCPNAEPILSFLRQRAGVALTETVAVPDTPMPARFAGSPTVLIEGINPFSTGHVEAAACALHPPTVPEIERAIAEPPLPRSSGC